MKKRIKVWIGMLLCMSMVCWGVVTGCNSKKQNGTNGGNGGSNGSGNVDNTVEDTKNLKILFWAKGYGSEWIYKAAEAFEKKYEGVNVEIELVQAGAVIDSGLRNPETNDVDLYFDTTEGHKRVQQFSTFYNDKQAMRDLTHLYNTKIPGEDVTLGEKMNQSLRQSSMSEGRLTETTDDDVYYMVPYMTAAMGLYYNETVLNNVLGKGNWEVPRTSDELEALCDKLAAKGSYMLVPGGLDQWMSTLYNIWWAQYEGIDNFRKFFEGIGFNKSMMREEQRSRLIFEQPGRLASLEASHGVMSYESGHILKNCIEIGVKNLNEYQTRFMLAKNKYAFYPCGDWLLQEIKNNTTVELDSTVKMMKAPVISSIIDATNSYSANNEKRLPNITSDKMLSQVVAYIDGEGTLPAGVTESEVEYVRSARNMVSTKALEHVAYSPVYCNAKTLADNFLLFLASDEGIGILNEYVFGGFAPYQYDGYKDLHVTEQSLYDCIKDAVYVATFMYSEVFNKTGIQVSSVGAENVDSLLTVPNNKSAKEINQMFLDAVAGDRWDTYMSVLSD